MQTQSIARTAKDHRKLAACAINPITGGPTKKPIKLIVETEQIARLRLAIKCVKNTH